MDIYPQHIQTAIDALDYMIKRLAVQAILYKKHKIESARKHYERYERARQALEYLKQHLAE